MRFKVPSRLEARTTSTYEAKWITFGIGTLQVIVLITMISHLITMILPRHATCSPTSSSNFISNCMWNSQFKHGTKVSFVMFTSKGNVQEKKRDNVRGFIILDLVGHSLFHALLHHVAYYLMVQFISKMETNCTGNLNSHISASACFIRQTLKFHPQPIKFGHELMINKAAC